MVVMRQREIRFSIAVDVPGRPALSVIAVGDEVLLPHRILLGRLRPRILIPPSPVHHPSRGDNVGRAVVVHIEGPFSTVGNKLIEKAHGSILMAPPLAAGRSRILIPVSAAQNIGTPITIHVERSDALGMIRSQAMDKECRLRHASRRISRRSLTRTLRSGAAEAQRHRCNDRNCKSHFLEHGFSPRSFIRSILFHASFIASGSHFTTAPRSRLILLSSAAPAARNPNTASSTTGRRERTAAKKFVKWSYISL